jgi:glucoamylase
MVTLIDFLAPAERDYVLQLADCWNERIETWTYTTDGEYCESHTVPGYYVRLGPALTNDGLRGMVDVRNRRVGTTRATSLVGLEFLYLVRMGLRRADDPGIVATVGLIDELLKVDTPSGCCYRRYNGDGYGEHEDGSPYDGTGVGRLWPLLSGERGHYALLAGDDPQPYLDAMNRMTGPGGLIPEQIWDTDPIPERGLFPGKPSGSAMPLVWAHAEFLKLLAAKSTGRPVEMFDGVLERWNRQRPQAATWSWRQDSRFRVCPAGRALRFEAGAPFAFTYALDGASDAVLASEPTQFGLQGVTLSPEALGRAKTLRFRLSIKDGAEIADEIGIGD